MSVAKRLAIAASLLIAPLALVDPLAVRAGEGGRPAPQAGVSVPDPTSDGGVGQPTGPGGRQGDRCAAVERVARRYLTEPDDTSPRQIALRREVQRALGACRGDDAPGRS